MDQMIKPRQLLATITMPAQEQSRLNFCDSNKVSAVQDWADNLKATKVLQTSAMLYKAVPEIPKLQTDYKTRFEMLETLRPSVQYCILGLQKTFLNQPLTLPAAAQKSAIVAQSLQKNMIDGYLVTIFEVVKKGKAGDQTYDLLAHAVHRAINGIALLFFRNYQIYAKTPASLWSTLNILYLIAEHYQITNRPIKDPTLKHRPALTISSVYTRALMMATAKTNQVGQSDIQLAFDTFEIWNQLVKINRGLTSDAENFLVVNLLSSEGPVNKSSIKDPSKGSYIELDFKSLLSQLSKQSVAREDVVSGGGSATVPRDFPESLLNHLINTWGAVAQRKYNRRALDATAEICVGLSDCHFYVCNGQDFEYFIRSTSDLHMQKVSRFSSGLTPASKLGDQSKTDSVPIFRVLLQNDSAGGYCMLWQEDIPSKVHAGEIVGVRETGKRTWSIGVIRWIKQLKNASQLGVQILANNAKPYALAQNLDGGYYEFMRALFLPPTKFGHGHPTLLTASNPFREQDSVKLLDGEKEWRAKLDKVVFSTKSLQQFRFRKLDAAPEPGAKSKSGPSSIDSEWK